MTLRVADLEAEHVELKSDVNQLKFKYSKKMNDDGVSVRTLDRPPTSCQELKDASHLEVMDAIYLLQNSETSKIQAVFCQSINSNQSIIPFLKRFN